MTDVIYIDGTGPYAYEFTEHVEVINYSTIDNKRPDSNWFVIDDNGHFHAFNMHTGPLLPTLTYTEDFVEGGSWEYHCLLCNELVVPHFMPDDITQQTRSAGFTIPRYNRSVSKEKPVSFYTSHMFGIARAVAFGIDKLWDGKAVSATFECEVLVRRQNDL